MADIGVALVLDDSQYTGKLDAAQKKAVDFSQKVDAGLKHNKEMFENLAKAAEQVKSKMESLGAAIVGIGLLEFLKSTMEGGAMMVELGNSIGITTQSMMELQLAGALAGKSAQDVAGMIQKMNVAAQDASDGNTTLRDSFSRLGISMNDLRKMSPDEAFSKIAHSLAAMEDPARRAQLASELMGKAAKMTDWGDLAGNIDRFAGSQKEAATATESAKIILDELAAKTQLVRNEFLLLLKPALEWIQPFIEGTDGAKRTAMGLLAIMALFAGAGTLVAINSIKDAVVGLAGAFGLGSAGAKLEAGSLEVNSAAVMENAAVKMRALTAKVASYEASVAEARANLTYATTEAEASIATATLERTTWRLVVAKGALAEATGVATGITAASVPVMGGASVAATGFAGAMLGVRTAVVAAVGPIGAFIAAAGSLWAVYQATFGEKHGIWGGDKSDHSGANFISDFFGITDSTAGEAEAKTKEMTDKMIKDQQEMQKKLEASLKGETGKPKTTVLNPGEHDLNPSAAAAQSIRNQTAQMQQNNTLAAERLKLELSLVSASDEVRAAKLQEFDTDVKKKTEVLRIEGEIKRLQVEAANSREKGKNSTQIAELTKQKQLIIDQTSEMAKLKGELVGAENSEKARRYIMEDQLKVSKEVNDIRLAMDELTMTNDEKKLNNIKKQVNAQLDGLIKIKEAQLGRKLTDEEIAPMKATITADWEPAKQATQDLIDKSRQFDTGWTKAWKDFADNASNEATRASEMFNTFEKSFESVFEQMVRTGKVNWNSLLQDMVVALMKSDVQRLFANITSGSGGGGGSIWGQIGSLFHASGGDIPAGQVGVVGEVRPELVQGPARVGPSNGSAATNVTYNINAVDAKSFQAMIAADPSFIYAVSQRGQRMLPGGA
jgi:lambda family phage tail tape measure protein